MAQKKIAATRIKVLGVAQEILHYEVGRLETCELGEERST